MKNILLTCFVVLGFVAPCYAKEPSAHVGSRSLVRPLVFLENNGQIHNQDNEKRSDIDYVMPGSQGMSVYIGPGRIQYQHTRAFMKGERKSGDMNLHDPEPITTNLETTRMDVELIGANKHAERVSSQISPYYETYYTGNSGENGMVVHSYRRITYKDVYPHIDWVLYTSRGTLKHEFVVHKGGRVSDIRFRYGGAAVSKDKSGNLLATMSGKIVREDAPICYQQDGKEVAGEFKVSGNEVSYDVAEYDGDLVIDPSVAWIVTMGPTMPDASSLDDFNSVAANAAGDVYVCGRTTTTYSIATTGAYMSTFAGSADAILAKYNSAGTLLWCTYYGGSSWDVAYGIAVDASGDAYVVGSTQSATGISTSGSHQPALAYATGGDGFLVKFDASGSRIWGTYYGGISADISFSVATDAAGNVYMAGQTYSTGGIATLGAHQDTKSGPSNFDGFLVKFSSTGVRNWGTYYGGTGVESAFVAVDNSGNPILVGETNSTSGISTPGVYQPALLGDADAYIAKFDPAGGRIWATYFGGGSFETGNAVACDGSGNIFITGYTFSTAGIATPGAYQPSRAPYLDAYLAKFDNGGAMQWGTYLGGDKGDIGYALTVDSYGNIYLGGKTSSAVGMATSDAFQGYYSGGIVNYYDAFIARFSNAGVGEWVTYYGFPSYDDIVTALAAGPAGRVYAVGTKSDYGIPYDFPAYGDKNGFLIAINNIPSVNGPGRLCIGSSFTYTHDTTGGTWSSSNPLIATVTSGTGLVSAIASGTFTLSYTISSGTIIRTIMVDTPLATNPITGVSTLCAGGSAWLGCGTPGGAWSSSDAAILLVADNGGISAMTVGTAIISYSVSNSCGTMLATKTINVMPAGTAGVISGASYVCIGDTIMLSSTVPGGTWTSSMSWIASAAPGGVITGLSGGASNITYSVATACGMAVATRMVTVTAVTPITISGTFSVCATGTVVLSATVPGGTWVSSAPGIASIGSAGVVTGISAGTAAISYTGTGSCGTTTTVAIVTVVAMPPVSLSGPGSVCSGSSISLTATPAGGTWTTSDAAIATVLAGAVSGVAIGTSAISYMVTGVCGPITTTHVVTVSDVPSVPSVTGASSVCVSGTVVLSGFPASGTWSSGSTSTTVVSGGAVTGVSAGTGTITYTVSNVCGVAIATHTVDVLVPPALAVITGAATLCAPGSATLSVSLPGGTWSSSDASVVTVSGGILSAVASGVANITYTLTNACGTTYAVHSVTVNPLPSAGTITGSMVVCEGSTILLTASVTGGAWSTSDPSVATVSSGLISGLAPGVATISYVVSNSCGTAVSTYTLSVNPLPIAGTVSGPGILCAGATGSYVSSGDPGTWSSSVPSVAVVAGGSVTALGPGSLTLTYTVTNACGTAIATLPVVVNPTPDAGTISGAATVCVLSSATLTASVAGGVWTVSDATIAGMSGSSVSGLTPGIVTVSYSVTNICGTDVATHVVAVQSSPSPAIISGVTSLCISGSATLGASVPGGSWISGDPTIATVSGGMVTGLAPGTVTVYYLLSNTCGTTSSSYLLTVNTTPWADPITGPDEVCPGSVITLVSTTSGGVWESSSSSATVSAVGLVTGVSTGTATISYSVSNSCGVSVVTHYVSILPDEFCATMVGEIDPTAGVNVFPNPSEGTFTVVFGFGLYEKNIAVTDMLGRVVYRNRVLPGNKRLTVDLPQVSSGSYLLSVRTKDVVYYRKIIVTR